MSSKEDSVLEGGDSLFARLTGSVRHQTTAGNSTVRKAARTIRQWKVDGQYDDYGAGELSISTECFAANEYELPGKSDLETISEYKLPLHIASLWSSRADEQPTLQTNAEGTLFVCSYQDDTALIYGTARYKRFAALRPITQGKINIKGDDTRIKHNQWLQVPQGPSVDVSSLPQIAKDVIPNS